MDNTTIQSIWTVLVFITFIGIIFWAYSGARKKEFDAAANSILEDDLPLKASEKRSESVSNPNNKETS